MKKLILSLIAAFSILSLSAQGIYSSQSLNYYISGTNSFSITPSGIMLPVGAGVGKVLTSDVFGNTSWQTPQVSSGDTTKSWMFGYSKTYGANAYLDNTNGYVNVKGRDGVNIGLGSLGWTTIGGGSVVISSGKGQIMVNRVNYGVQMTLGNGANNSGFTQTLTSGYGYPQTLLPSGNSVGDLYHQISNDSRYAMYCFDSRGWNRFVDSTDLSNNNKSIGNGDIPNTTPSISIDCGNRNRTISSFNMTFSELNQTTSITASNIADGSQLIVRYSGSVTTLNFDTNVFKKADGTNFGSFVPLSNNTGAVLTFTSENGIFYISNIYQGQ